MKSEAVFKKEVVNSLIGKVFCIETEDTEPGFPDIMQYADNKAFFIEVKVSDNQGWIQFKKSQPPFYLRNKELRIQIAALDNRSGKVHRFLAKELFSPGPYMMNDKRRVKLPEEKE